MPLPGMFWCPAPALGVRGIKVIIAAHYSSLFLLQLSLCTQGQELQKFQGSEVPLGLLGPLWQPQAVCQPQFGISGLQGQGVLVQRLLCSSRSVPQVTEFHKCHNSSCCWSALPLSLGQQGPQIPPGLGFGDLGGKISGKGHNTQSWTTRGFSLFFLAKGKAAQDVLGRRGRFSCPLHPRVLSRL